jgi:hypothetical protein
MMKKKKSNCRNDSQDIDSNGGNDLDENEPSQNLSTTNLALSSTSSTPTAITINTPESLKRVGSSSSSISRKVQRVQR